LFFEESFSDTTFFLRKDGNFYHLYFNTDTDTLQSALIPLMSGTKNTIVTDLIGMKGSGDELSIIFEQAGFMRHASLFRMAKIIHDSCAEDEKNDVEYAKNNDVPIIHYFLDTLFDPYAEQIPSVVEIENAVRKGEILIAKDDGNLAGFLFFERTGLTSLLRYWFVDERYRDKKYGAKLMHAYFSKTEATKRYLLWVIRKNKNAIKKYEHYGYKADNLIDQVMLRKGIK
jgi:GNAT superfamily N-acetyltransferase